jgi:hypothetical protein
MHEWQLISLDHNYLQHQNVLYTRYIKNCHFILYISAVPLLFVCAVTIIAGAILL